jgi:hypothetical protein
MLIGIMGKMGSGKTLSASILGSYLSKMTGAPLSANYNLTGALPLESLNDINDTTSGIEIIDEAWLSMDARGWENNVRISHWVNQTRKKKVIVFYTTQHIRQMEMRVRNATDILIVCEKTPQGIWLNFIDYQYRKRGKKFLIEKPERFYSLYDTYEVLKSLQWDKKKDKKQGYSENKYQMNYTKKRRF